MASTCLLVDQSDEAVIRLTLNRPEKRNALSIELIEQLRNAVRAAAGGKGRVLILRGAGPAFCAGLDLAEAAKGGNAERSAELLCEMYEAIATSPLVTIAAARGAALGGGAGLVAACDFAIVGDDFRVGYPEIRRGLVAALVTCLLRRQLSDRGVRELVLLGQSLSSAEAMQRGLVSRVVAVDRVEEEADALAREICKGAPQAISRTKRLLDDLGARPIAEDLRLALRYHLEARDSAEAAEGIAAFREKREPRWPV